MHVARHHVPNLTDRPLYLVLEPWAHVYPIEPRQTWVVTLRSVEPGKPEVVREPGGVTVYAWPGCVAEMSIDGVVLEVLSTPAHAVPPGQTMRRFVESTYGPHPSRQR